MEKLKFKAEKNGETVDVFLYGIVGWEFTAKDIISAITEDVNTLNVHINSCGGDVLEGNAIYNAIKNFQGETTATIDGMAGSAASYIMLACKTIKAHENATIFIHNPLVEWASGNAKDLEKIAEDLKKFEATYVSAYMEKTGKDEDEIRIAMDDETLFTAREASEFGLVDEVISDGGEESEAQAKTAYKMIARYFAKTTSFKAESQEQNKNGKETKMAEIKDKQGLIDALNALKDLDIDAIKAEIDNIVAALENLEIKEKEAEPKKEEKPQEDPKKEEDVEAKIAEAVSAKVEEKFNALLLSHGFNAKGKPEAKSHTETYNAMEQGAAKTEYFKAHKAAILAGK